MLIYSQFVIMLNILEDYLTLKNYGFLRIDGGVGEMSRLICVAQICVQVEVKGKF